MNILDLDPVEFAGALEELALPPEESARLRDMYKKKNSAFSSVYTAMDSAQEESTGRNTGSILPLSAPAGKSIASSLVDGDWEWAVPEGLSQGVESSLQAVEAPGQMLRGVPFTEQEATEAGMNAAALTGGLGSIAPAPENSLRIFGGLRAKTAKLDPFVEARQRLNAGEDPTQVWKDTGVARNKNGQLRFEIDDEEFEYKGAPRDYTTLDNAVQHDELFKAYPQLRNILISEQLLEDDHYGFMDFSSDGTPYIVVNSNTDAATKNSTVLHEIQHIVQSIEDPNFNKRYEQNRVAYGYHNQPEEIEAEQVPARLGGYSRFGRKMIKPNFASGGVVEGNEMEQEMSSLLAEGGVNTGNASVDPVSGNEVPPGSMPEEVRDDVPAKLSGGEYVIPADVLRFYGVSFFEKLRKKAKEGLAEMDAEGRIGGKPQEDSDEEEDDLPFNEDELMFEDEEPEMAAGGVVPPSTFNPNAYGLGFSVFGNTPNAPQTPQAETKTYINEAGVRISIQFLNGQPQQPIPVGFYPEGEAPPTPEKPLNRESDRPESETRQNTEEREIEWGKGKDWGGMSPEEAVALANERLNNQDKLLGTGAQLLGVLSPLAGLVAGAGVKMRPIAEVNGIEKALRESGNEEAADAVAKIGDSAMDKMKPGMKMMEPIIASGNMVAKGLLRAGSQTPAAQQTRTSNESTRSQGSTGTTTSTRNTSPTPAPSSPTLSYGSSTRPSTTPSTRPSTGYSLGTPEGGNFNGGLDPKKDDTPAYGGGRAKGGLIQRRKKK